MKRTISIFIAITLLLTGMSSIPVMASSTVVNSGSCGDNLTWTLDEDGLLTISGTGPMYDYQAEWNSSTGSQYAPWYDYPSGECSAIKAINIKNGITHIGNTAFFRCSNVEEIIIPSTVTTIGQFAFWDCSSATCIIVSENVTELPSGAFMGCDSLQTIYIGKNVSKIDYYAFGRVSGIEEFVVENENEYFSAIDGNLFNKDATKLIKYTTGSPNVEYSIPDGVTEIEKCAFCDALNLESLMVPEGVEEFRGVFYDSEGLNLKNISLPSTLTTLSDAFSSLTDFVVTYNGREEDWNNVTGIDCLPEDVTMIYGTEELLTAARTSLLSSIYNKDVDKVANALIEDKSILAQDFNKINALSVEDLVWVADILCTNQYVSDSDINAAIALQLLNSSNTTYGIRELYADIGIGSSEVIDMCSSYVDEAIQDAIDARMLSYNQFGSIHDAQYYYDESTFLEVLQKVPSVMAAKEVIENCMELWGLNTSRYQQLSEDLKMQVVCECIGRTYSTKEVFINVFMNETEEVYAIHNKPSSDGGGVSGGGAGGSGSSGPVEVPDDIPEENLEYTRSTICNKIVEEFGLELIDEEAECPFMDIEDDENYEAIMICEQLDLINGFEDRTFKPQNTITNAELSKLVYSLLYYIGWSTEIPEDADYDKSLWFGMYAWLAEDIGIMKDITNWHAVATTDSLTNVFDDIGYAYRNRTDAIYTQYKLEVGNPIGTKDSIEVESETAPIFNDGKIYCSARMIAELLDIVVTYDAETKEITFTGWNKVVKYTYDDEHMILENSYTYVNAEDLFNEILGRNYSIILNDTQLIATKNSSSVDYSKITVGNVTARRGKEVVVPIKLSGNNGLTGLQMDCTFDEALTLIKVETGEALTNLEFTTPGDLSTNAVTFLWDGMDADYSGGVILYLTFSVSEETEIGNYEISLDVNTACDQNLKDVNVVTKSGMISVIEYILGDVNEDDEVNVKDIILIRRYIAGGYGVELLVPAANIDEDDEINVKDIILLRRFIAGGYGVELN